MSDWKDPEIGALRATFGNWSAPPEGVTPPLAELRRALNASMSRTDAPSDCRVEINTLAGVAVERLTPSGASTDRAILYLHGGGYVYCSARTHRALVARLASAAGVVGVTVDYRLAPEHPFPAALDDALAVYRALLDEGMAADKIAIAGDSAGGGLTVATALTIKAAGLPLPGALFVISPWTDLTVSSSTHATRATTDPLVDATNLHHLAKLYLDGADPKDPLASPAYGDLSDLPPILIQVGSEETLLGDALLLANQAAHCRVRVHLDVWPEMVHVWQLYTDQLRAANAALDAAGHWLRHQMDNP